MVSTPQSANRSIRASEAILLIQGLLTRSLAFEGTRKPGYALRLWLPP